MDFLPQSLKDFRIHGKQNKMLQLRNSSMGGWAWPEKEGLGLALASSSPVRAHGPLACVGKKSSHI